MDIHLQPKMDPKVRVAHNYCKHGDVHDHPYGTCRDLFDWCEDCYNDKRILDWEERGRFESSDDFDADN
ncbi:hypothetical protein ACE6H2_006652 [Prunus campanulata]